MLPLLTKPPIPFPLDCTVFCLAYRRKVIYIIYESVCICCVRLRISLEWFVKFHLPSIQSASWVPIETWWRDVQPELVNWSILTKSAVLLNFKCCIRPCRTLEIQTLSTQLPQTHSKRNRICRKNGGSCSSCTPLFTRAPMREKLWVPSPQTHWRRFATRPSADARLITTQER